jgi:hypothetical protein
VGLGCWPAGSAESNYDSVSLDDSAWVSGFRGTKTKACTLHRDIFTSFFARHFKVNNDRFIAWLERSLPRRLMLG